MEPSTSPSDALSVIGFFLTLVGLVGSFFYIHLSDWLREVIAVETKWNVNEAGDESENRSARMQCRYEVAQAANWTTLVTSLVVTLFILFMVGLALALWLKQPQRSDVWGYIGLAGAGFLGVYLGMTIYLLARGYGKARRLMRIIQARFGEE